MILDGEDGAIIFKDTLGAFQYASPLTFDFTDDGYDDVLVVINNVSNHEGGYTSVKSYSNEIRVFDIHNQNKYIFYQRQLGSNLGSTPLLTDLDGDGYLDVTYCYMNDNWNFYSFESAIIERIETEIKLTQPIKWGEYMGSDHDGVFRD